jgi:hypothetical protein
MLPAELEELEVPADELDPEPAVDEPLEAAVRLSVWP